MEQESVSHCSKFCRYASTCQTVGMNLGYFTSFTVFLALNDPDFCNKYLRHPEQASKQGVLLLGQYMRFWGVAYLIITVCVWLFKREDNFQAPGQSSFLAEATPLPPFLRNYAYLKLVLEAIRGFCSRPITRPKW